jgi:hypothetical protein
VFLNPYIRQQPFSHAALTHANIYEITARLFTCIFNRQPDLQFLKAFEDYFSDTGDFSRRSMHQQNYNFLVAFLGFSGCCA